MKVLLGRKIGMSQVFSSDGEVTPVTLIQAHDNVVTLRRLKARDGHDGIQLGLPSEPVTDAAAAVVGKPAELTDRYVARREFHGSTLPEVTQLGVTQFALGDVVTVAGISKGKGFQGVVKRHGFKGGPASHGHSDWERKAGSIGSRFAQHVRKGKRMAGRMGTDRVTVKNLEVMMIDPEQKLLALKGAVPGKRGAIVEVYMTDVVEETV